MTKRARSYGGLLARGALVVGPAGVCYAVLAPGDRDLAAALAWVVAFGMMLLVETQWPWGEA